MQKQERLMIKQLENHQNIEENLPKYAEYMSKHYYEHSLIQLAMNLYTFQERSQEYVSLRVCMCWTRSMKTGQLIERRFMRYGIRSQRRCGY